MKYVNFTDEEKIKMFDEISEHFYNANFGQSSKSDIELMMFNFYIQKMINQSRNPDNTIDYKKCSDYKISKDLGITQQKIRNLKVKNQLVNPIEYDWKAEFAKLVDKAKIDNGKIIVSIPDPNLYYEIENFIEEMDAYIEKQLNNKILQLRVEYFLDLVIALEPEQSRKEIRKKLKENYKKSGKDNSVFDENNIGKSLLEGAVNVTAIVSNLSSAFSPSNAIAKTFLKLIG